VRGNALMGEDNELPQFIWPSPIHSHAFHASNSDQLNAYIITAIPFVRNVHQPLSSRIQIGAVSRHRRHLRRLHGVIEPVAAQQQDVARYTWMSLVSMLTNKSCQASGSKRGAQKIPMPPWR